MNVLSTLWRDVLTYAYGVSALRPQISLLIAVPIYGGPVVKWALLESLCSRTYSVLSIPIVFAGSWIYFGYSVNRLIRIRNRHGKFPVCSTTPGGILLAPSGSGEQDTH